MAATLSVAGCDNKDNKKAQKAAQAVGVVVLHREPATMKTEMPGRVSAYEIAQVRPQVNGVIIKRLFEEGTEVRAGQQLYQIDPSPYLAAYNAAKASLARAIANQATYRAKLRRYKPLAAAHAVSQQDYDDALAAFKANDADIAQARADIQKAEVNLRYTKVLSPITGRIGRSLVTVGALAVANQSNNMAVVTRLDPVFVDVNIPSSELLRLKQELKDGTLQRHDEGAALVHLTLENGQEYPLTGKMAFSEVTVDQATSTVVVRAVFPNPDDVLLPGMYVQTQLIEGVDDHALLVPQQSVSRDTRGEPVVMVVGPDNKVSQRSIKVGQAIGNKWKVTAGLEEGERVIVTGLQRVRPGAVVNPQVVAAATPAGSKTPSAAPQGGQK